MCIRDSIKYIRFSRNFGRESGILAGFKYASGDAVMVMDGDLQHPPYLIPLFLEAYNEGYDIVSGQRTREGESFVGSSFARLFYFLSNRSMDVHLTDGKSELRPVSYTHLDVYKRQAIGLWACNGIQNTWSMKKKEI